MNNEIRIERRIEKRAYLKYASSFTILTPDGLLPFDLIELVDVSKDGLSFMIFQEFGEYDEGDQIESRLYLNSFGSQHFKYYLPLTIKVMNKNEHIDKEGIRVRYGCNVEVMEETFERVLKDFIKFIESASQYLKEDRGDYFMPTTVA